MSGTYPKMVKEKKLYGLVAWWIEWRNSEENYNQRVREKNIKLYLV